MWLYIIGAIIMSTVFGDWYFGSKVYQKCLKISRKLKKLVVEVSGIIRKDGISSFLGWAKKVFTKHIGARLVEMHHHYYIIHYPYGMEWYKMKVKRTRGPGPLIDNVIYIDPESLQEKDITKDFFAYFGPCHDFHGQEMTPEDMGYSNIKIEYMTGEVDEFIGNKINIIRNE